MMSPSKRDYQRVRNAEKKLYPGPSPTNKVFHPPPPWNNVLINFFFLIWSFFSQQKLAKIFFFVQHFINSYLRKNKKSIFRVVIVFFYEKWLKKRWELLGQLPNRMRIYIIFIWIPSIRILVFRIWILGSGLEIVCLFSGFAGKLKHSRPKHHQNTFLQQ